MAPWLLPAATAILSAAGTMFTNKSNQRAIDKQLAFQERMSSSAAQRSVEDYRRAGLNPALAYDRSASSPGGGATTFGDPTASGISSARATIEARNAMRIANEQHYENLRLTRAQTGKAATEAATNERQGALLEQQYRFNAINQPQTFRLLQAEADLKKLLLPGARNTADFEEMLGKIRPGITSAKTLAEILKLLNSK